MTRNIDLAEHESQAHHLTPGERDLLSSLRLRNERKEAEYVLRIEPTFGPGDICTLRTGSVVGALEFEGLSLLIRPKIGIPQLMSLACFTLGIESVLDRRTFRYLEEAALPDALAWALAAAAERAFAGGLLHGYLSIEESLYSVRGRIMYEDQIRIRPKRVLPLEVRYDDFTDDIIPNQMIKAAAYRLGRMHIRSPAVRVKLGGIAGMLENVSLVDFPPRNVPEVRFDRLNQHYRHVVGLSRLILMHSLFEAHRGQVQASGFLMDMDTLFQQFVTKALREAVKAKEHTFSEKQIVSLDTGGEISLRPDLTWWDSGICRFVGDAKYKNLTGRRIPNGDLYQLLAYVNAADLPGGLLVYAKDEVDVTTFEVRHSGKRLRVATLDLSVPMEEIQSQIRELAEVVKELKPTSFSQ